MIPSIKNLVLMSLIGTCIFLNASAQLGVIDLSFNPGFEADNAIFSAAVQSDGKILIDGDFTSYNGTPRNKHYA